MDISALLPLKEQSLTPETDAGILEPITTDNFWRGIMPSGVALNRLNRPGRLKPGFHITAQIAPIARSGRFHRDSRGNLGDDRGDRSHDRLDRTMFYPGDRGRG